MLVKGNDNYVKYEENSHSCRFFYSHLCNVNQDKRRHGLIDAISPRA